MRSFLRWVGRRLGVYTPVSSVERVPNQPATPTRSIRIPDDIWEPAVEKAHNEGTTVTEVVIKCLQRFLRD